MQFITVNDALERVGFGRFQKLLIGLSGLGFAGATVELIMLAQIKGQLPALMGVSSPVALGWLMSVCFIGELIGASFWGFVSDKVSRRNTFVGTAIITACFAIVGLCTVDKYWLFLGSRLGLGFGLGGSLAIDFIYFLEFSPRSRRSSRTISIIYIGVSALAYVALAGMIFLPGHIRWYITACAAPMLVLAIFRTLFPWETPHFLYSQGRYDDCKRVLEAMARMNGTSEQLSADNFILVSEAKDAVAPTESASPARVPWTTTIIFAVVFFCQTLAYYGFTVWMHQLAAMRQLQNYRYAINLLTIALFQLVGVAMTQAALKHFPVKFALAGNFFGAAASLVLLAVAGTTSLTFLLASSLTNVFIVGVWTAIYVQGPPLFAVPIRARMFGACASVGKLGGIAGPLLIGMAMGGKFAAAIGVVIACYLVGGVTVLFLPQTTVV